MGEVHQISISNGGVPKLAVEEAVIDVTGVVGDVQADQVHHGHPEQALCLFSLEVIEQFRSEGHPIDPGSAGENITLRGLDWSDVTPGTRLRIGGALVEITGYTTPCAKNARWFIDGRYNRMHVDTHPDESRVYARVISGGTVVTGDTADVLDE
jgi:MOSC domain-containing protein YiiM